MAYASNLDLPDDIRRALPTHAQDVYRETFNHALGCGGGAEREAIHRIAWTAVKMHYEKLHGVGISPIR